MPYTRQFGGVWDDILGAAKAVLPATGTIVGGDVGQAFTDIGTALPAPSVPAIPPVTKPTSPIGAITAPGGALGAGGFVEKNQTLLLLGAAALVVFLVMGRRRR